MKLFYVTVFMPSMRKVRTKKGYVMAESMEAALLAVRNHYPPTCVGWPSNARFSAVECEADKFWEIGS